MTDSEIRTLGGTLPESAPPPSFRGLRVVIVAPRAPPPRGMAVQAALLAENLTAEGVRVTMVTSNPTSPSAFMPFPAVAAAWRNHRFLGDVHHAIADRADVLHIHASSGPYFRTVVAPALREGRDAGMRTVLRWDGPDLDRFLADEQADAGPEIALADEVLVASPWLAAVFKDRLGRDARVVPKLVNDPDLDRAPVRRDGPLRLVCTRPLTPTHGVGVVLAAAAIAAQKGADLEIVVAGEGPERRALEETAERTLGSRATFVGSVPRDRVRQLLADGDVLVNGSWVDDFPTSIAEALAAGLPVLTTDSGGIPWVVQHGRTGLVTPAGDVEALAASILSLADDRTILEDLSWRARVEALRWTWPAVREQYAQAYGVSSAP